MTDDELIEYTNRTISEIVYLKYDLQKAYNYYNGKLDADQFRYIEEQYGINNATQVKFIPLIRKHIDALVGEYLSAPIIPKVSCKDSETISKITREKELYINKSIKDFLQKRLQNKLLQYIQDGQKNPLQDMAVQEALDKLKEDLNDSFISQYEIAAQDVIEYIMQSRSSDMITKLRQLFTDLLVTGYTYYRVKPSVGDNDVQIEVLNPLNTFIDKNPESPYIKDSYRCVVRKWLTKTQILNIYGKDLSKSDRDQIKDNFDDIYSSTITYIRSFAGQGGVPLSPSQQEQEPIPGYPTNPQSTFNYKLIPVYEVEWTESDKDFVMQRYKTVRIGNGIHILYGKDEQVVRSQSNPSYCSLSVNGVYFTNRGSVPYSLVLACADLQDKYNLLCFYRDNLIANSGTTGSFIDVSVIPSFLGADLPERLAKLISYKKAGTVPIDSSQAGRAEGGGTNPLNTIYNGYNETVPGQAIQAIQIALDSIEQNVSSITGVFKERLNGIQQRDAVTNVQMSVNNSFTITKAYYQQMDVIVEELLIDALNIAKRVFKNGLKGTIVLGDTYKRIFTAMPEYFTLSDYDVHVITSSDITRQLEQLKQIVPELVKANAIGPDLVVEAMTTKSLTDLKQKISKAMKKQKEENNQIQQLQQQLQQGQQQMQQMQQQLQQAQQKVEQLNEQKLQLEQQKLKQESDIEWFKAKTDKAYKTSEAENNTKRTEIELKQMHDGDPYNDKIVQMSS